MRWLRWLRDMRAGPLGPWCVGASTARSHGCACESGLVLYRAKLDAVVRLGLVGWACWPL
eukprot:10876744-Prorocentrum_lima.AAC.1